MHDFCAQDLTYQESAIIAGIWIDLWSTKYTYVEQEVDGEEELA